MTKRPPYTPQDETARLPPHALEAEQALLGTVLLDHQQWNVISERVSSSDFYFPVHQHLFTEMQQLYEEKKPIDLITLSQALHSKNLLDAVGGFAYLAELSKNSATLANSSTYAEIVRERAIFRSLISVAREIAELGFSPQGRSSELLLDIAESKVFQIAEKRMVHDKGPQHVHHLVEATVEKLEKLCADPSHNGITGIATGFIGLDKKTAGFQPGDLIVVAARPAMGKTTFAMNICEHIAMAQAKPVLVFSLEMPAEQLILRLMSSFSRVEQTKIRTGQLLDEDWARLSSTVGLLKNQRNLYIDDSSWLTPSELRARARRIYHEHEGLAVIMVDYLQLMRTHQPVESRTLEIAEISRALKSLAKELHVPVIALSQLNRGLEQRSDKRPINSDLRDSGSIEQDADLVLFIYRDEVYHDNSQDKGTAEVIVGKHRNGPMGTVKLLFQGQYARFDNLAPASFSPSFPPRTSTTGNGLG